MLDERASGPLSTVAIDLTREELRGYGSGKVIRWPAAVFGDDAGNLAFGDEAVRLGRAAPAGLEPRLLDWIDDGHLALSRRLHGVGDMLRGLLQRAVADVCGPGPAPDLAVLAVPEYWGGPRRGVLEHAAAGVARRVEVVSSASAILAGALLDFPDLDLRKVVVVEREHDRLVAALAPDPSSRLTDARGDRASLVALLRDGPSGEAVDDPDATGLVGLVARAAGPGLPASAVVIAPRGGRELPTALWAMAMGANARVVDADCALRGAVSLAESLSAQF